MRKPKLYIYRTRSTCSCCQRWGWTLVARNGEIVCNGEGYSDKAAAEAMGTAVKNGVYSDAVVVYR